MSERKAVISPDAEGTLLIGDGTPIWLDSILTSIGGAFLPSHEEAFLAVVFVLMYESGFYFIEGPRNRTIEYDVRVMKQLMESNVVTKNLKKENSRYVIEFSHNLIYPKTIKLVAYPFTKDSETSFTVINFLIPEVNKVDSFVFDTELYTRSLLHKKDNVKDEQLKMLSVSLKNHLHSYKSIFPQDIYHPHHVVSLPLHILYKLVKLLDGYSFLRFIQSCKYLYDIFYEDQMLWRYFTQKTFPGLEKLERETWQQHFKYLAKNKKLEPPPQPDLPALMMTNMFHPPFNYFDDSII